MLNKEDRITISDEEFRLLREFIRDYSGIYFDDDSKLLLEKRLNRRLLTHNIYSFRDYYRYLLYNSKRDEELSAIMDILTVNETYFFREKNQLNAFKDEILPELKEKNLTKKRLKIVSAGCSTGEEPYTIGILIKETGLFDGWDIQIIGSDINRRVLSVARQGVYGAHSFRGVDDYYIKRYFKRTINGKHQIKDEIKKMVFFANLNLLDSDRMSFLGNVDTIFCRNVLIYFDLPSRKKVVEGFYQILKPGGYLLLGHAESLINISTDFILKHLKNDLVYQKPSEGEN